MNEWIPLKKNRGQKSKVQTFGGTTVRISVSPHDIPMAVRGTWVADGKFRVEFQYLDDEPGMDYDDEKGFKFRVGKHSGRLQAIVLPQEVACGQSIQLDLVAEQSVERALNSPFYRTLRRGVPEDNGYFAREAIKEARNQLFAAQ